MYLVDTNVISEGATLRSPTSASLVRWMDENSSKLYLSAVTIAEIEDGIAKARRQGAVRKAGLLMEWLEAVLHLYASRILPLDVATARVAGRLSDRARASGHAPGFPDVAIAASAQVHSLIVLTCNTKHFAPFGVPTHDPFDTLPK